ncbi:MAG: hypothetical protein WAV72_14605 [Bradyrhizobium sp.]
MNVSAVSVSIPVKPPEASAPKPPEVKTEHEGTRLPQPTVLAALPPGQGTRVNQLA